MPLAQIELAMRDARDPALMNPIRPPISVSEAYETPNASIAIVRMKLWFVSCHLRFEVPSAAAV